MNGVIVPILRTEESGSFPTFVLFGEDIRNFRLALIEPFYGLRGISIAPGNPHRIGWKTSFIEIVLDVDGSLRRHGI